MGVRACDKNGCTNVMCDRSSKLGYICNECFEKLVKDFSTDYNGCHSYEFWDDIFPEIDRDYGHPSNWD